MARFDVYPIDGRSGWLMVDVQSDLLKDLASRVAIPLIPVSDGHTEAADRLKPVLSVGGQAYILLTTDIAARPVSTLGKPLANIEAPYRDEIVAALDFLFQGF